MSDTDDTPDTDPITARLEAAGLSTLPATLESLPEIGSDDEEMTPRGQRIAAAISMVSSGQFTAREASEYTGAPMSAIWKHKKGQEFKEMTQEVEDLATAITIEASQVILQALRDGSMTHNEAVKALSVNRDTLAKRQHWDRESGAGQKTESALMAIMNKLADKLPNADPVDTAVEVAVEHFDMEEHEDG